jgi:hypothetical protein
MVVWRVQGQRLGGDHQEGRVHHGNTEAALVLPVSDGDVLWGALVVSLRGQAETQ